MKYSYDIKDLELVQDYPKYAAQLLGTYRKRLQSAVSLMRKFYSESEITERGDFKISHTRYPDMMKDLLAEIKK